MEKSDGERQLTFEKLGEEFDTYYQRLLEEKKGSGEEEGIDERRAWVEFLLTREDDGSWAFLRAVEDTLHMERNKIVKAVEDGQLEEAGKIGSLTRLLNQRLSNMYQREQNYGGRGGVIRTISPPIDLSSIKDS